MRQSTAQFCWLQDLVSVLAPHALPPKGGRTVRCWVREEMPPPHALLHGDQPPQVKVQSIGQAWELHSLAISRLDEHSRPPYRAGFCT